MFCGKCGAKNPDGSKFCSSCGSEMTSSDSAPVTKAAGAKKLDKRVVIGGAVAVVALVLVVLMAGSGGSGISKKDISGKWYVVTGVTVFGEENRQVYSFGEDGNLYCWMEGGAFDDSFDGDSSIGTWKVVDGDSVSFKYDSMKTFFYADEGSEPVKVSLSEDGQELTFYTDKRDITLLRYPSF